MFLVACSPDLLICQDISDQTRHYAEIEVCQAALTREIDRHRARLTSRPNVMAKCGYILVEPHSNRFAAPAPLYSAQATAWLTR